jgi:AcrR family transcriptional regulator
MSPAKGLCTIFRLPQYIKQHDLGGKMTTNSRDIELTLEDLPARERGKKRYYSLLTAALELLSESGIRGLRHRALAEKAQVPLSATTYYFADLDQLKRKTFELFCKTHYEEYRNDLARLLHDALDGHSVDNVAHIADSIANYLHDVVRDRPSFVRLYALMSTEALWDQEIAERLAHYRLLMRETLSEACAQMGLRDPVETGHHFFQFLQGLWHELGMDASECDSVDARLKTKKSLQRFLSALPLLSTEKASGSAVEEWAAAIS